MTEMPKRVEDWNAIYVDATDDVRCLVLAQCKALFWTGPPGEPVEQKDAVFGLTSREYFKLDSGCAFIDWIQTLDQETKMCMKINTLGNGMTEKKWAQRQKGGSKRRKFIFSKTCSVRNQILLTCYCNYLLLILY